ncbi:MAG: mannose-6-phosphate isomerase, class I, partial [Promicromonosporaceae bacterium]|nr:mannose-6-phosphate isomerase, class I [Promicromonosporaceae bacterium]
RPPVSEFAITLADVNRAEPLDLPASGPRVVLCFGGAVQLRTPQGTAPTVTKLAQGESVFVPDAAGRLSVHGDGRIVVAWVP